MALVATKRSSIVGDSGNRRASFTLILKAELSGIQFCLASWVEGDSFLVAPRWRESEGEMDERGMKEI